jgi:hypothetical protein
MYASLGRCGTSRKGRSIERLWGVWGVEADVEVVAVPGALRGEGPERLDPCPCTRAFLATGHRGPVSSSSSTSAFLDDPTSFLIVASSVSYSSCSYWAACSSLCRLIKRSVQRMMLKSSLSMNLRAVFFKNWLRFLRRMLSNGSR